MAILILQPDETQSKDTWITNISTNENKNYGSDTKLMLGLDGTWMNENSHILIQFDLSPLSGAKIKKATLELYCYGGYTIGFINSTNIHPITSSWLEDTVTWNNQPSYDSSLSYPPIEGFKATKAWWKWDITSLVQKWVKGELANNGMYIWHVSGDAYGRSGAWFYSSNYTDPTLRPKLVIEYDNSKYLFQDGTEIKKYATPGYSSDLANGGNIFFSSQDSTNIAANAFDNNASTFWKSSGTTLTNTEYIGYEFTNGPKHIRRIVLNQVANQQVSSVKIEKKSYGDADWTLVHTANGLTSGVNTIDLPTTSPAHYWRIVANSECAAGAGRNWCIHEIEMMEYNNGWITIGTAPATKDMFDQHGMIDLSIIDHNAIQQLISDTPELLCWTDEEESYSNDLIPTMTSDTAPSGVASADSTHVYANITYSAYRAFNNSIAGEYYGWASANTPLPHWLSYDFGTPKIITKYSLQVTDTGDISASNMPKSWEFQGYDNITGTWITLDTRTNEPAWTYGEKRTYTFNNTVPYSKYRIYVTENGGSGTYANIVVIGEMEMMESVTPSRTLNMTAVPLPQLLLPVGDIEVGEIESVKVNAISIGEIGSNLIPVMTSNTAPSGIASASSYRNVSPFYYPYKSFDSDLSVGWQADVLPSWLSYEFPTPQIINQYAITARSNSAYVDQTPKSWTFEAWDGTQWIILDNRTGQTGWQASERRVFEFSNNQAYQKYRIYVTDTNNSTNVHIGRLEMMHGNPMNTDIKIVVSGDSGISWQGKNGTINISDLSQVKVNGYTPDELNTLTKQELASLFPNGTARFAFYLEQEKSTDIVQIDSLKINEKVYTMTPSIESLKVIYNLLETEKPKLYVSRDDGVTWKEVQPDALTSLEDLPEGNKLRIKAVLSNGQELHALSYSWI
jgi:F5/8 type C domain